MTEPFLTTVVDSMPKPAWLFKPSAFHSATKDRHGSGSDWGFEGDLLHDAQDDATRAVIMARKLWRHRKQWPLAFLPPRRIFT